MNLVEYRMRPQVCTFFVHVKEKVHNFCAPDGKKGEISARQKRPDFVCQQDCHDGSLIGIVHELVD